MDLDGTTSSILSSALREANVNRNEDVRLRCRAAKKYEDAADSEAACAALGDLWQGIGQRPRIDDLDEALQGEVLLHAGANSSWIGHTRQIEGVQEVSKDLIFESLRIFERLALTDRLADAQIQLAVCYWR